MAKAKDAPEAAERPNGAPKKLRKLVKDVRVAMLATMGQDGRLRSRPMMTSAIQDRDVWFIARASSLVADEIRDNQRVNLSYADLDDDRYLSVSGTATLVRDPDRLKEFWSRKHKAWFPQGKKDPDLTLLRVAVEQAECWDDDEGRMVPLAERPARKRRASAQGVQEASGPATAAAGDEPTGAGAQG